jgi:hypothetical protein
MVYTTDLKSFDLRTCQFEFGSGHHPESHEKYGVGASQRDWACSSKIPKKWSDSHHVGDNLETDIMTKEWLTNLLGPTQQTDMPKLFVEALVLDAKNLIVWDTEMKGFGVVLLSSGKPT